MASRTHRRTTTTHTGVIGAIVAAAVIGGTVLALTGTAQAAAIGAAYTRTSDWNGGYTGQYVVTNETDKPLTDWTLEFDLPAGTSIGSLWNGEHTVKDGHVTVKPASWDKELAPGKSVTVGFVTSASGTAGDPAGCLINDAACSVDGGATPTPSGRPTDTPTTAPTPTATPSA
ncbi:cellulose binding domain-containing protein, partial [Streptomyces sp. SM13]|uniref:cellulose binding domain-containing protein n=1 Tax=Streptomyces sp. SM13 TaxID=1983803 RepID=UPI0015E1865C